MDRLWIFLDKSLGYEREQFSFDAEQFLKKQIDWSRLALTGSGSCVVVLSEERYRNRVLSKFGKMPRRPGLVNKLLRGVSGRLTLTDKTDDEKLLENASQIKLGHRSRACLRQDSGDTLSQSRHRIYSETSPRSPSATSLRSRMHLVWLPSPHELWCWRIERLDDEPKSILWNEFGKQKHEVIKDFLLLVAGLVKGLIIFSLCFVPFLFWTLQTARLQADDDASWWITVQEIITGILMALGGEFIVHVVTTKSQNVGAVRRDRLGIIQLAFIFFSSLIMILLDVVVALKILLPNFLVHCEIFSDSSIPTTTYAAAEQVFELLVPGYLILPYIAEPLTSHVVPYWLHTRLIRAGPTELQHAEEQLCFPEVEIVVPLSDLVVNVSCCAILFFFITDRSWQVWGILLAFVLGRYIYYIVTFSFFSTKVTFDTDKVPFFALRIWSVNKRYVLPAPYIDT
eukprot:GEMP01003960.1.p1 GENE.GEMP01003960.1~~GEMP01003960.1.p1  ORF type:complete len:455 (+),score=61.81 GEMP01003960.1:1100-2464(+)